MKLDEEERELLSTEVAQAMDQVRAPQLKTLYGELLSAVDAGEIPDELIDPLQNLLEVGLESGRIRRVHLAHGEMAATRVFNRTPHGRALAETTRAVNEALEALQGHVIEEVTVSANGPGAFSFAIGTEQGRLLVRVNRHGARIQSVEVGG